MRIYGFLKEPYMCNKKDAVYNSEPSPIKKKKNKTPPDGAFAVGGFFDKK